MLPNIKKIRLALKFLELKQLLHNFRFVVRTLVLTKICHCGSLVLIPREAVLLSATMARLEKPESYRNLLNKLVIFGNNAEYPVNLLQKW